MKEISVSSMNIPTGFWRTRPLREKFWLKLAYLLPRNLVYWACIRLCANATTGKYENQVVPDLTVMDALKRWEDG